MFLALKKRPHLFAAILAIAVVVQNQSGIASDTLKRVEKELQALMASTKASIVTVTATFSREIPIESEGTFLSLFRTERATQPVSYVNIGSGVILDEAGHILTRNSVVRGAGAILVTLSVGSEMVARLLSHDPETGFALLKVESEGLAAIHLGDSDEVLPGSLSLMVGNSLGVYPSIVLGAINAIRADGMIQLSAALTPGNNGSPIINLDGEVVGLVVGQVNTTVSGYESLPGFHVSPTILVYPSNRVRRIAADLIKYGRVRKGWLGVVGYHDGWKPKIRKIREDSPAQKAGLITGDVIVKFSGKEVGNIPQLAHLVEYSSPGETVAVEYQRSGQTMTTNVEIGEKAVRGSSDKEAFVWSQSSYVSNGFEEMNAQDPTIIALERHRLLEHRINELGRELDRLKKFLNSY